MAKNKRNKSKSKPGRKPRKKEQNKLLTKNPLYFNINSKELIENLDFSMKHFIVPVEIKIKSKKKNYYCIFCNKFMKRYYPKDTEKKKEHIKNMHETINNNVKKQFIMMLLYDGVNVYRKLQKLFILSLNNKTNKTDNKSGKASKKLISENYEIKLPKVEEYYNDNNTFKSDIMRKLREQNFNYIINVLISCISTKTTSNSIISSNSQERMTTENRLSTISSNKSDSTSLEWCDKFANIFNIVDMIKHKNRKAIIEMINSGMDLVLLNNAISFLEVNDNLTKTQTDDLNFVHEVCSNFNGFKKQFCNSYTTNFTRCNEIVIYNNENLKQLNKVCNSYCICLDETTENNQSIICVECRYKVGDYYSVQIITVHYYPQRKTGQELCDFVIKRMKEYEFDFKKCIGVCSDGANNMCGMEGGFIHYFLIELKNMGNNKVVVWNHCFNHRLNLVGKSFSEFYIIKSLFVLIDFISSSPVLTRIKSYCSLNDKQQPHSPAKTHWCYKSDITSYTKIIIRQYFKLFKMNLLS